MPIYRGTTPLKAYKGDMQPVNVYRGSTKVAGWHLASYSGTSPLTVDCDYNVPPDALVIDGRCVQTGTPSPDSPAPITTITGDMTITGADGAASDTATVAFGSAVCASLPDGTHDSYDAVTGVLTKRVGKYVGESGTSWTISDAATSASFMSDRIPSGTMSGQTVTSSAVCTPTIYYKLATPTTVQLVPHLPVVRTGIKTLSIGADVVPTLSATVKSMESAITSITQG